MPRPLLAAIYLLAASSISSARAKDTVACFSPGSARRDVLKTAGAAAIAGLSPASTYALAADGSEPTLESPSKMKRVLVIGGNGRTGRRIVQLLNGSPSYQPVAMIRDVAQKPSFDEMGVPSVLGDLRYPIDHLLNGVDVVIFAAGGRTLNEKGYEGTVQIDLAGAIRAISSCQASSTVRRFVMLSGANVAFETTSKITHWHRAKAYADTFLRDSATFGRPLDWTIVCPAALNDDPLPIPEGGTPLDVPAIVHPQTMVGPGAVGNSSRDLVAAAIVSVIDRPNTSGKEFLLLDAVTKEGRSPFMVGGEKVASKPLGEALSLL